MIYLEYFTFPDSDREFDFFVNQKRRKRIRENDGSECDRRKTSAFEGQCI